MIARPDPDFTLQDNGLMDHLIKPRIGQPSPDDCDDPRNEGWRLKAVQATVDVLQDYMKARGSKAKCALVE